MREKIKKTDIKLNIDENCRAPYQREKLCSCLHSANIKIHISHHQQAGKMPQEFALKKGFSSRHINFYTAAD